ncbi:hypothetical protein CBM2598_U20099 [Cupriavidus taiwanensis]|uniref:Uncharacterized protein n=1 Tax=Cupriavidus taiwanensis TaxID=164546 RepID=A0A7Z7JID2_9BURK|nr:hypothetical protein CBM2597_U20090 [Cupriavidus taiwanensis]SOZ96822.1 hypothetical protein CBM2598_U20099 [Cupriavidus taiwanensis]SPC26008.1 hypothetical protein CBM2594_U30030 [Cupriavidus taiwanensis]
MPGKRTCSTHRERHGKHDDNDDFTWQVEGWAAHCGRTFMESGFDPDDAIRRSTEAA